MPSFSNGLVEGKDICWKPLLQGAATILQRA